VPAGLDGAYRRRRVRVRRGADAHDVDAVVEELVEARNGATPDSVGQSFRLVGHRIGDHGDDHARGRRVRVGVHAGDQSGPDDADSQFVRHAGRRRRLIP
jgi:hypothetical protein